MSARGRLNVLHRYHPPGSPAIESAALALKVARARDYLRTFVTVEPVPSPEQRAELAELLTAQGGGE